MASIAKPQVETKVDLAAEVLRRGGTIRLKASGTSMLPSLWPGDLLTIQSAGCDQVAAGDILLVVRHERFFIHRLVGWRLGSNCLLWITKGDAMPHCDPPATASDLLGRVTYVRRGHRGFVPSRRVSLPRFALAWMLCHWNRFRNLALRVHGLRSRSVLEESESRRDTFQRVGRIPIYVSRSSHQ